MVAVAGHAVVLDDENVGLQVGVALDHGGIRALSIEGNVPVPGILQLGGGRKAENLFLLFLVGNKPLMVDMVGNEAECGCLCITQVEPFAWILVSERIFRRM